MEKQVKWIVGIDEVGRGPLAGPVTVGAFAIQKDSDFAILEGVRDSKKLSEKKREAWFQKLTVMEHAKHAVVSVSSQNIDTTGIQSSIRLALKNALKGLQLDPNDCELFLDGGLHAPAEYKVQETVIRGDDTVPVISAASIVAKVTRDRLMVEYDKKYPEYGLAGHKGYGTKRHREVIATHGFTPIHRISFCKNISVEK